MHAEATNETATAARGGPGENPATARRRRSIGRAVAKAAGGVAACVLALSTGSALAAPADPNVITTVTQKGGEQLRVHLWGDEFIHGHETLDGYSIVYDAKDKTYKYAQRDARGRLKPSKEVARRGGGSGREKHLRPTTEAYDEARIAAGAPAAGALSAAAAPNWAGDDTDILFLMVEFKDTACSFTPTQMQANMFGGAASGPGDLDDYFNEISYGKLKVAGNVVGNADGTGCIKLANDRAYYSNNDNDPKTTADNNRDDDLVREAVQAAKDYVTFEDYDNNNDGTIDALGIIYAGGGQHDGCAPKSAPEGFAGDHLWPHKTDLATAESVDGKNVQSYIINSELTYEVKIRGPPASRCRRSVCSRTSWGTRSGCPTSTTSPRRTTRTTRTRRTRRAARASIPGARWRASTSA